MTLKEKVLEALAQYQTNLGYYSYNVAKPMLYNIDEKERKVRVMQNKFFIGDLHIGDETIIQLENRPFANAEEQTVAFVKNWNSVVEDNDIVYVMGDFIIPNLSDFHIAEIRKLKGKKILVK